MDRKDYIGGSDIAAVMGVSRWTTALQLWAEKTGTVEAKDLSGIELVQLGTELEDFVAKKFERSTGLKVRRSPKNYTHKTFDFMRCQVDRLIEKSDELLECKTCSAWKAKEWEGEDIPVEYVMQLMWQLGITGRKIGHIAVLIGGQAFRYKQIEFDADLFQTMMDRAIEFWNMVQTKEQPMAVGEDNSTIFQVYPENDEQIQQVQEFEDQIALLQETKMHIKEMEKEKFGIEASLKQRIGENLGIETAKYLVKWSLQRKSSVDTDALKESGLYEAYSKESKYRVLRVTKNKEKKNV